MNEININYLNRDVLGIILQPFKSNEESLIVGLVCKKWKLIVQRKPINFYQVIQYYYSEGYHRLSKWVADFIINHAVHTEDIKSLKQLFKLKFENKSKSQIEVIIKSVD